MSVSPVSVEHDGSTIGCQLELQIEASNLANMDVFSLSDPFALVEEQKNGKWVEVGRTETIWDVLNPKWVRTFLLPPGTPRSLALRVTIYDRDSKTQNLEKQEVIGSCVCRVDDILKEGCNGKTLELENEDLKETGTVTVIGELCDPSDDDHEVFLGLYLRRRRRQKTQLSPKTYCIARRLERQKGAEMLKRLRCASNFVLINLSPSIS